MKSAERAEAKCRNPCNNSMTKLQYSFGRDTRFKHKPGMMSRINYYNLPSQISKRSAAFGTAQRATFLINNDNPPPNKYNPNDIGNKSAINFAHGRDECKINSIFYTSTVDYPGPGNYNPEKMRSNKYASMRGKALTRYETISPGPKYHFASGMLDSSKVLSKQKCTGAIKIVLPSNHSRRWKTETDEAMQMNLTQKTDGMITRTGERPLGQEGVNTFMTRERRFAASEVKNKVPGPGFYKTFSDFIDQPGAAV